MSRNNSHSFKRQQTFHRFFRVLASTIPGAKLTMALSFFRWDAFQQDREQKHSFWRFIQSIYSTLKL